jgi:hypothetical protein
VAKTSFSICQMRIPHSPTPQYQSISHKLPSLQGAVGTKMVAYGCCPQQHSKLVILSKMF